MYKVGFEMIIFVKFWRKLVKQIQQTNIKLYNAAIHLSFQTFHLFQLFDTLFSFFFLGALERNYFGFTMASSLETV